MQLDPPPSSAPVVHGMVLTGGGARAAYQVGVLQALSDIHRDSGSPRHLNPFQVITGTSAGAINASALATGADDFWGAVDRLVGVWRDFRADQVYRADAFGVARSGARWLALMSMGWAIARWRRMRPRSLLDNTPLQHLLREMVPLERIPGLIAQGHLQALAVSASSYSTGQHVTFFDGKPGLQPWVRSQRHAVAGPICQEHLLASSAIPFVFPAMALHTPDGCQYFGDGSMRQSAPIAPAIHLGARKVLVVGAGRLHEPRDSHARVEAPAYPTLAQIAGHALSNIFLDALSVDVERVQRINQTLSLVPASARRHSSLQPIDLLVIAPSRRLDEVAAQHLGALPRPVLMMLGALGVSSTNREVRNAALASYLLFEAEYTRELMALGHEDTMQRRDEIGKFFGWTQAPAARMLPPAPPLSSGSGAPAISRDPQRHFEQARRERRQTAKTP
jgi:NTE family protein